MDTSLRAIAERLKAKADEKRARGHLHVDSEYAEDMRSIDRLATLDGESVATPNGNGRLVKPSPPDARLRLQPKPKDEIGPAAATREAVASLPPRFTVRDIYNFIVAHHPNAKINKTAISSALNRLTSTKEIECVQKAQGREPGKYERRNLKEVPPSVTGGEG